MKIQGNLLKMRTVQTDPVQYYLSLAGQEIEMNTLIGKKIHFRYLNEIHCIKCGRKTSKSFAQGFCYPCFRSAPETEECVLRPELCRAHEGIARDMDYARQHCLNDHYVYLSFTSGLKVGVTRQSQIPTRWIDQGAVAAIPIAKTPNRYTAGLIEVALKKHFADKTHWRTMLKDIEPDIDLIRMKREIPQFLPAELSGYYLEVDEPEQIHYPLDPDKIPLKVSSINLEKTPGISDTLVGIKGQYLIFEHDSVLNVRTYGGYLVELEF
jgi:hypothetical protein